VQKTIDVSSYAGQSVTLSFKAETDSSFVSSFYVDDVSLPDINPAATDDNVYLPLIMK
jgi:hypothetical protein